MATNKRIADPETDRRRVKVTVFLDAEDDYVVEAIVLEEKRRDRRFSKTEYFRELMRSDRRFVAMKGAVPIRTPSVRLGRPSAN